jgi:hypothetical protein
MRLRPGSARSLERRVGWSAERSGDLDDGGPESTGVEAFGSGDRRSAGRAGSARSASVSSAAHPRLVSSAGTGTRALELHAPQYERKAGRALT